MKTNKIILLTIGILLCISYASAYDIQNELSTSQLPMQITEPLSASVSDSNVYIYINSTSDWISIPNSIYISDYTNIVYFNATINVPENTSQGDYIDYVYIRKGDSSSSVNISFLTKIIDTSQNLTYNKTDLIIEIRNILNENVLPNVSVRITDGTLSFNGSTDRNGRYRFVDIEMKKWLLYILDENYEPILSEGTIAKAIYLDKENELKSFYVINKSIDLDTAGISLATLIMRALGQQAQDELDFQESQTMTYINNTIFETSAINREGWYDLLRCNPENVRQLNNSLTSWTEQSLTCMKTLDSCVNNVSATREDLNLCIAELDISNTWRKYNILLSVTITLISVILGIGGFFGIRYIIRNKI